MSNYNNDIILLGGCKNVAKNNEYVDKKMYFANFNITFGKDSEPMLTHFFDIIYPSMTSGYERESPNRTGMVFLLSNIEIKNISGDIVLVGNYIKNMSYSVNTQLENGELEELNIDIPTSPYSRFIIYLKNHRMVLIKNESASPDIRSFQVHIRTVINQYIITINKEKSQYEKLPVANINIVDMPFENEIRETLIQAKKIKWVKFRFFPLNADIPPMFANDIVNQIKLMESRSGNLIVNSPKAINPVVKSIQETVGLAEPTVKIENYDGSSTTIKGSQFKSNMDVTYNGNINSNTDGYLVEQSKKNEKMLVTSEENQRLFDRVKTKLERLIQR